MRKLIEFDDSVLNETNVDGYNASSIAKWNDQNAVVEFMEKEHGVTGEKPQNRVVGHVVKLLLLGAGFVGKSTIFNTLAGRMIAKTGNEPAVTKVQQRINLRNGIVLSDTPGILWPKVDNEKSSYRLAITGAIKDTAMEYEDVAMFAAEYFLKAYPEAIAERYKLTELPDTDIELLEAIGRKRGALRPGGRIDLHKVSELVLHEFRSGKMGQLSLETPEMAEQEKAEVAVVMAEKAAKDEKRKEKERLKQAGKRHR